MAKRSMFSTVFLVIYSLVAGSATGTEPIPANSEWNWVHEIRFGILKHDVPHLWSGSRNEGGYDFNGEIIFARPRFSLLKGMVRPNFGLSVNDRGDTSRIYGGLSWEFETKSRIFLNLGAGAALHDGPLENSRKGDEKEFGYGLPVVLRIPIEVGYSFGEHFRISILFSHISNAFLASPNEGLDALGVRFGYRF